MVIPINKQGGRATYYYPGDGYLRRYDDFGVTQISLEAWMRRQDAEKAFWGGSVRWVDDPTVRLCILNRTGSKAFGARSTTTFFRCPRPRIIATFGKWCQPLADHAL